MTNRSEYENYLNELYDSETCLEKTEHCWAGNDKTKDEKESALRLAELSQYGTVLRYYDPIAFIVGYNEWKE
jgi:hypothetical protein